MANLLTPWVYQTRPFQIFGNLYFVGTQPASTHLIDTGDGLVIIDPGYQEYLYMVLENIRTLGFNPQDIRYLVHSHGHIDHAGATRALAELTGAKTFIGKGDRPMVVGEVPLTCDIELKTHFNHFEPDHILHDGDHIRLGNLDMECIATPGHTPGTFSFFWNITKNGRTVRAGMMGGAGMNTLASAYIHKYHLEAENWRGMMQRSIPRCRQEHVDLFVGNHAGQNDTFGKQKRLEAGDTNAFVQPDDWTRFLDGLQRRLDDVIANDPI